MLDRQSLCILPYSRQLSHRTSNVFCERICNQWKWTRPTQNPTTKSNIFLPKMTTSFLKLECHIATPGNICLAWQKKNTNTNTSQKVKPTKKKEKTLRDNSCKQKKTNITLKTMSHFFNVVRQTSFGKNRKTCPQKKSAKIFSLRLPLVAFTVSQTATIQSAWSKHWCQQNLEISVSSLEIMAVCFFDGCGFACTIGSDHCHSADLGHSQASCEEQSCSSRGPGVGNVNFMISLLSSKYDLFSEYLSTNKWGHRPFSLLEVFNLLSWKSMLWVHIISQNGEKHDVVKHEHVGIHQLGCAQLHLLLFHTSCWCIMLKSLTKSWYAFWASSSVRMISDSVVLARPSTWWSDP